MGLLSDMLNSALQRVAEARERVPEAALRAAVLATPTPPPLRLHRHGFDVIAELKLRSPSLGDLSAATLDPVRRLEAYAEGGAAVCSILTEPTRFDGDLEHLRLAAETLQPYGVPAMRKDFLVEQCVRHVQFAAERVGELVHERSQAPVQGLAQAISVSGQLQRVELDRRGERSRTARVH